MIVNEKLQLQLKTLPENAGVYQYFDANDKLLYVGKAKNLKKRVLSYFNKEHETAKLRVMVSKIQRLETIVVDTEFEALLLENNLIKKHQPRYNSMLRDDKTYPWICIKNEPFPRIFLTRKFINDGSEYFGPFPSVRTSKNLLEVVKSIFLLRTCSLDLHPKKIAQHKYKVCLEYHIGNCLAPCIENQSEEDYNQNILSIKQMIKGNFSEAMQSLKWQMKNYAQTLAFEKAQRIKEKIELLENYQAKSTVVNPSIKNVDVFSLVSDTHFAYINYLKINNGAIIQSYTTEYKKVLDNETESEILTKAVIEIRQRFQSDSSEIFVPFPLELEIPNAKVSIPKIGDKKHIIELSLRNAKEYKIEQLKKIKITDPERHTNRIMQEMKQLLHLPEEPKHIEGFDNSNIQGTNPASVCVVFKNGKPSKNEYRKYNIKTVEGPNDFASMEEVIYRRYSRLLQENQPLPNLILIDGGKGQLSAAQKSLELLGLKGKIAIIGIAKRLEEIYFPNDSIPLYLDKTSETLKVLQHVRNEAHRFSVKHHRTRRSNNALLTELENIKGIGEKTVTQLLKKYKSLQRIKSLTFKDIAEEIGKSKAQILMNYFNNTLE